MGALEPTQSVGQGGVGTPELLAQAGKFKAQSASFILYTIQIASVKVNKLQEIRSVSIAFEKPAPFTSFYAPFPHCLNRREICLKLNPFVQILCKSQPHLPTCHHAAAS